MRIVVNLLLIVSIAFAKNSFRGDTLVGDSLIAAKSKLRLYTGTSGYFPMFDSSKNLINSKLYSIGPNYDTTVLSSDSSVSFRLLTNATGSANYYSTLSLFGNSTGYSNYIGKLLFYNKHNMPSLSYPMSGIFCIPVPGGGDSISYLSFWVRGPYPTNSYCFPKMFIFGNGRVLIKNTNSINTTASAKLDINGDLKIDTVLERLTPATYFLTQDSSKVKYRTLAKVRSDLGCIVDPGSGHHGWVLKWDTTNSYYWSSDTGGGGGGADTGITSINGATVHAQTIAGDSGISITESGTGNYLHTVKPSAGRTMPYGVNGKPKASILSDTATWAYFSLQGDSSRAAYKTDTAKDAGLLGGFSKSYYDTAGLGGKLGLHSPSDSTAKVPDSIAPRTIRLKGSPHSASVSDSICFLINGVIYNCTKAEFITALDLNASAHTHTTLDTVKIRAIGGPTKTDSLYGVKGWKNIVGFFGTLFGTADSAKNTGLLAGYGKTYYDTIGHGAKLGIHATADSALGAWKLGGYAMSYHDTVGHGGKLNLHAVADSALIADSVRGGAQRVGGQTAAYLDTVGHGAKYTGTSSTIRGLLSSNATGLTYTNSTGVFTWTSGYMLPTGSNNRVDSSTKADLADSSKGGTARYQKTDVINGIIKSNGSGTYSAVTDNSSNWNTAYGWGNWSHTTLSGYGITDAEPKSGIAGTANYIQKGTGTNAIGNSQIYDDGSFVGINAISNTFGLRLYVNDSTTSIGSDAGMAINNSYARGNVGLWLCANKNYQAKISSDTSHKLLLTTWNTGTGTWNTGMTINNVGNVGIGTTNPRGLLEVRSGNGAFIGDGTSRTWLGGSAGVNYIESGNDAWTASALLNITGINGNAGTFNFAGNVGVNTNTPRSKLDVNAGDILIGATQSLYGYNPGTGSYSSIEPYNGSTGNMTLRTTFGTAKIVFQTAGANDRMTIDQTGKVGIGTTIPSKKLEVSGGIKSDTVITGYDTCQNLSVFGSPKFYLGQNDPLYFHLDNGYNWIEAPSQVSLYNSYANTSVNLRNDGIELNAAGSVVGIDLSGNVSLPGKINIAAASKYFNSSHDTIDMDDENHSIFYITHSKSPDYSDTLLLIGGAEGDFVEISNLSGNHIFLFVPNIFGSSDWIWAFRCYNAGQHTSAQTIAFRYVNSHWILVYSNQNTGA